MAENITNGGGADKLANPFAKNTYRVANEPFKILGILDSNYAIAAAIPAIVCGLFAATTTPRAHSRGRDRVSGFRLASVPDRRRRSAIAARFMAYVDRQEPRRRLHQPSNPHERRNTRCGSILSVFGKTSDSDPLSRWVPYGCFVDDSVFTTNTGYVGMTIEMEGVEYETLSQENMERVSDRFTAAHRNFDERFRVYHHLLKRTGEQVSRRSHHPDPVVDRAGRERVEFLEQKGLYSVRVFTTVLLESDPVKPGANEHRIDDQLNLRLNTNIQTLKDAVASYAAALGSLLGVTVLDRAGIFEHLCLLTNPDSAAVPSLKYNEQLGYFAANTEVKQHPDYLDWGGYHARVFALKEEPDSTFAHMLRSLMRIESNVILAYEWKRESNLTMTRLLRDKRKKTWGQRYRATDRNQTGIADEAATAKSERLNEALAHVQANGNHFGHFSLIATVFDEDTERLRTAVSALHSGFRESQATLIEERKHRLRSFFAMIPGNSKLNIRYRYLLNLNYADLAPLYRPGAGDEYNARLDAEYLTVLETTVGTPYYLNLHVGQVAASLITGTTGSGKSVLDEPAHRRQPEVRWTAHVHRRRGRQLSRPDEEVRRYVRLGEPQRAKLPHQPVQPVLLARERQRHQTVDLLLSRERKIRSDAGGAPGNSRCRA